MAALLLVHSISDIFTPVKKNYFDLFFVIFCILFFQSRLFFFFLVKSQCHTKRRAGAATRAHLSFGIKTTQAIMDLFA